MIKYAFKQAFKSSQTFKKARLRPQKRSISGNKSKLGLRICNTGKTHLS